MTLEQLQYFLAVEKYMNFSIAADDLCVSQSSLSKQIKAIENELSVTLFNRNTRNITLTNAGMEFSIHAKRIVDEHNKMLNALKDYSSQNKRSICITSIPVMNQYGVTDMITSFKKGYPDVDMIITEKDTQYVIKSLENPHTDLVILRERFLPQGDYKIFPLVDDELVLITNSSHRFADRESIHLSEAANENFILLSTETCLYNTCLEECTKAGFIPHTLHTNIRLETIKSFVLQGLGVSLMMNKMARYFADPNIRIIKLHEKPILTLSIVTRDEPLSSVCSTFIKYAMNFNMV